ncbi:MAG: PKD domain-containing protein [Methanolinea sp.]|jgi:PKD repeat protein|nr:PKD domain-containing protein [Methanolinea sp.]
MSGFRTIGSSHGIKGLHLILIGILLFIFYCVPSSADVDPIPEWMICQMEMNTLSKCEIRCFIKNHGETNCLYWINTCKASCAESSSLTKSPTPGSTKTPSLSVSVQTNANSYTVGDPYTISISVEDASTNSPVSGASLTIASYNQNTGQRVQERGTTNSAGKYSLTGTWSEGAIGTITITATATKASFTTGQASTSITVSSGQTASDILQAAFSANPVSGNSPLKVQFSDRSTGNPNKWRWEFGDGAVSTSQNPVHTYTTLEDVLGSPDYFTVTLTIWNTQSSDVASKVNYITVYPGSSTIPGSSTASPVTPIIPIEPPRASFTAFPSSGPAPLRVSFSDTSTGTISSHFWDFGDGYKSELANPSHTFKEPGTYTVKLTVGGAGGTDTARKTISINTITDNNAGNGKGDSSDGEDNTISGTPIPLKNDNDSLTPEDIGAGAVAGIAGVIGGLFALGSGSLSGIIPGMRPPPGISPDALRDLQDEYRRLMDTLATEKANREAWAREGKDAGRDGIITLLEEEARRRREELERLGALPEYEGTVTERVGPGTDEKNMLDLERKLDSLSDWAGFSRADLDQVENIYQKFLEIQELQRRARENSVTWRDGFTGGLRGTIDDLTSGVLMMGYPQAIADAIREAQPKTLTELYSAFLVGIGRNTGELINPVNLVPYHEMVAFYKWYSGDLDLSWSDAAGLGGSTILKSVGLGHIGKKIGSLFTKTISSPEPSVSKLIDIEQLKKYEAGYMKRASPEALDAVSKTIKSGPDAMVVTIGQARKNPALLDAINKNPEIQKPLMEFDAKCHAGGKGELAKYVAKEEGIATESIYVHDYTGHKGVTELPHDHDATAYRYIPEGTEPPPHTTTGFDPTQFKPKGQLVGDGKHYFDFKEQTVKPIEPGQYYESSTPLSSQQAAYNQGYTTTAGTKLKPEYVGKITESNVTSHAHPEAYIEGDYSPKQYKIDNPISRAVENLEKASVGNVKSGEQAVADMNRAVYEASKTIRKASEHGTLQNLPESAQHQIGAIQNVLTSGMPVTDIMTDLRAMGTSIEEVAQMLKNLKL